MKDILRRLCYTDAELAVELIARGAFLKGELLALSRGAKEKSRSIVPARRKRADDRRAAICRAAAQALVKSKWGSGSFAGFVPALAHCDRQVAIHAVINAGLEHWELAQLAQIVGMQKDGHLLRQLRVAIELEIDRRKNDARRSGGNRIATKRG